MKKLIERLFIFLIGVPLFAALVLFLPWKNHLALNLVITLLSALGAAEFAGMLNKKGFSVKRLEAFFWGMLCPLAQTIEGSFFSRGGSIAVSAVFIAALSFIFAARVFARPEKLADALNYMLAGMAALVYPGIFMVSLIRLGTVEHAAAALLTFLLIVFGSDSAAWAAGMLFGRNNRGVIPASPNKSAAGFVGGLAAAVAAGILAVYFAPRAFVPRFLPPLPAGFALGFFVGAAASLGDLAESVMKRSAGVKDSGSLIPGRGGVLDSLDSVAFAAPVFFGLYRILFV
ncbi:MAG: phosphatidate cytidylyltransferase [Spirochaetaceae bacterium]|jgi:phosphatidate cytidylyltransferase|nr:phosphatidate cytidylyltransferase [Spirochaetaceae bacterium]